MCLNQSPRLAKCRIETDHHGFYDLSTSRNSHHFILVLPHVQVGLARSRVIKASHAISSCAFASAPNHQASLAVSLSVPPCHRPNDRRQGLPLIGPSNLPASIAPLPQAKRPRAPPRAYAATPYRHPPLFWPSPRVSQLKKTLFLYPQTLLFLDPHI